jgi:hypothetical protein
MNSSVPLTRVMQKGIHDFPLDGDPTEPTVDLDAFHTTTFDNTNNKFCHAERTDCHCGTADYCWLLFRSHMFFPHRNWRSAV